MRGRRLARLGLAIGLLASGAVGLASEAGRAAADAGDGEQAERVAPSRGAEGTARALAEPTSRFPRRALLAGAQGVRFVDEASCVGCHESEAAAWRGSHHDLAMAVASPEVVVGDFDDAVFEHRGAKTRFLRRGDDFYVEAEGPDGNATEYRVAYTFGIEPLQQYLIEFPGGRLQGLTVAWDTVGRRWFTLYPDDRHAPDDALHWTGRYQTWNIMCAECHSTDLRKEYDAERDVYETTWARIDVGCQACHGPGGAHVERARSGGYAKGAPAPDGRSGTGLVVDYGSLSPAGVADTCARCHARRHRVAPEDQHGRPFLDDFAPELLRGGLYEADGQIDEEVYVYGSFLQSRMYAAGVTCTDCHDPHRLALPAEGDAVCLQCHRESPPARFPSLKAAKYATPAHHGHPQDSEGARCVGCHMPVKRYMVVDPRRDHGFRIPRPDLSQKLGVRNACTDCHEDRTSGWAAAVLDERHGPGWRRPGGHAAAFSDARRGSPAAMAPLMAIAEDRSRPAIVRATALEQLRAYGPDGAAAALGVADDPEPLVRAAAAGSLRFASPAVRAQLAEALLLDPVRAVRVEAASSLAGFSAGLAPGERDTLSRALAELEAANWANADGPGSRTNLAVLAAEQGRESEAEAHYRAALQLDPAFFPASLNLATALNATGRNADAVQVLRDAIARTPHEGELHYSLGLLLAEMSRIGEAERSLAAAAAEMPTRARVRYNHALALQHLGKRVAAERELLEAQRLSPDDPAIIQALVILYVQEGRLAEALPHAERLAALVPEAAPLLDRIRADLARSRAEAR